MFKLLSVTCGASLGGAERSLLELARAMLPETEITVAGPAGDLQQAFASSNLPRFETPVPAFTRRKLYNPFALLPYLYKANSASQKLAIYARQNGIQAIHANTGAAGGVAARAARRAGLPFIWHCRDVRFPALCARRLAESSACVIAISQTVREYLLRCGVPDDKIRLIINGIDLSRFEFDPDQARKKIRAELKIPPDAPVLLTAGAMIPWKRPDIFADTAILLNARHENLAALVCGDTPANASGDCAEYMHEMECESEGTVQLLGERNDLPQVMAASDLYIHCAGDEPFGRVVAEAGSACLPCIVRDSGGPAEIVLNNITGLHVQSDSPAAFAEAVEILLKDPARRIQMGLAALQRINENFDIRRTAREMQELLVTL